MYIFCISKCFEACELAASRAALSKGLNQAESITEMFCFFLTCVFK